MNISIIIRKHNGTVAKVCIVLVLFFAILSCGKQNSDKQENNEPWGVILKLIPQPDETYLATEDVEIKVLILKHGVTFYLFQPEFLTSELLLLYSLTGQGSTKKENAVNDFLATGKFEDIDLGWAVEFILKPQEDEIYVPTEDLEIKELILKHGIIFYQSFHGTNNPELMPYYTLCGNSSMSMESREDIIKKFLATGKFEDYVREFEIITICN